MWTPIIYLARRYLYVRYVDDSGSLAYSKEEALRNCKVISDMDTENLHIHFFTGSQSTIHCLQNPTTNSLSATSCRDRLNQLANNTCITISWIAGHSGHQGNVRADELANLGRSVERQHGVDNLPAISNIKSQHT